MLIPYLGFAMLLFSFSLAFSFVLGGFSFAIFRFPVTFDIWCVDLVNITDTLTLTSFYFWYKQKDLHTQFTRVDEDNKRQWHQLQQQPNDPLKSVVQLALLLWMKSFKWGLFVEANVSKVSLEIYAWIFMAAILYI